MVDMAVKADRWAEMPEAETVMVASNAQSAQAVSSNGGAEPGASSGARTVSSYWPWSRFGRLVSGKLGINVGLAGGGNLQSIVDTENTAAIYTYGKAVVIGDHRGQDFEYLVNTVVGDTMEVRNEDGSITVLKCIRTGTGRSDGKGEYYVVNGKREDFDMNDSLVMTTCLDHTGENIFICEWVPADGSSITKSDVGQQVDKATTDRWNMRRQEDLMGDPRFPDIGKCKTPDEIDAYINQRYGEMAAISNGLRNRLAAEGYAESNDYEIFDVYTQAQADAYYAKVVQKHAAERAQAEAKAKTEAEAKAMAEAEQKTKAEAEAKAKAEAEAKKQAEEVARVKAETEAKAKAEADAKAEAEAAAKAQAEAEAKAKAEEARLKAEAEAQAKAEAERLAKEEAERLAREEAERLAREEAERLAQEQASSAPVETEEPANP